MKYLNMKNYIIYYRVSTKKQGRSGLGLSAQKTMCENYLNGIPNAKLIAEYTDIESGKDNNRTQLTKAITECKKQSATLVIAKLDRLSREVEFIFNLRNSGVDFVCCDMPDFNTLTLGIFATIAQHERELISERTKKALAEKKKQGYKLGTPNNLINNLDKAHFNSKLTRKNNALDNQNNKKAGALIIALRNSGVKWSDIVIQLKDNGFKARRGGDISVTQARLIYQLYQ